jgi:hypothetical protein
VVNTAQSLKSHELRPVFHRNGGLPLPARLHKTTWLQVMLNGSAIYSEDFGRSLVPPRSYLRDSALQAARPYGEADTGGRDRALVAVAHTKLHRTPVGQPDAGNPLSGCCGQEKCLQQSPFSFHFP